MRSKNVIPKSSRLNVTINENLLREISSIYYLNISGHKTVSELVANALIKHKENLISLGLYDRNSNMSDEELLSEAISNSNIYDETVNSDSDDM